MPVRESPWKAARHVGLSQHGQHSPGNAVCVDRDMVTSKPWVEEMGRSMNGCARESAGSIRVVERFLN